MLNPAEFETRRTLGSGYRDVEAGSDRAQHDVQKFHGERFMCGSGTSSMPMSAGFITP